MSLRSRSASEVVIMGHQEVLRALESGVLQAYDMTAEAAYTKLMWTLGQTDDPQEIQRYFAKSLAGEVCIRA